jgi:metal-dependent amidase/aminoacylase/carboxypeptidase family protein
MPGAATTAAVVDSRRSAQRAEGPATIIAIGTANPANIVPQDDFADYYFGLTKSEHLTELKDKMKRICKKIVQSTYHMTIINYFAFTSIRNKLCKLLHF